MNLEEVVKGIDHHLWSSEPDVGQLMAALIKLHSFKDVVEIGVFKGLTSSYMINSIGDGTYTGIDMKDYRAETVKQYMLENKHSFNLGDSKAELKKLPSRSADLIFLDGDHTLPYVKAEFLESQRIIRPKGIICIHDYNCIGVKAWVDFISKFNRFSTIVFDTSEHRGVAVVICKEPSSNFSSLALSWFNVTRSDFFYKVRDKLKSIKRNLFGGKS
jgi:predicted O-methyltransferase YrrM